MGANSRLIGRKKEREWRLTSRLVTADRDVLTALYVAAKGDVTIPVALGRQEIAQHTGLPLRTVDRALLRLRKRDLISTRRRQRQTAQIFLLAAAVPYCQAAVVVQKHTAASMPPIKTGGIPSGFKGDPKAFELTMIMRKPERYGQIDIASFYFQNATVEEQYRIELLAEGGSLPGDITGYGPLDEALRFWHDQRIKRQQVRQATLALARRPLQVDGAD